MTKTSIGLQDLRRRIYLKAKADQEWRFWGLYVHVCKPETLREAYEMARRNGGAAGIDGVTFADIEEAGLEAFLDGIHDELVSRSYRPSGNRQVEIPKDGGKVRILGIPTIRKTQSVIALIKDEANKCLRAPEGINFENKVVLSIATRLAAEQFMVGKLKEAAGIATIESNQTSRLLKVYRRVFPVDQVAIGVLWRVALMTPENIHLNSFMYEPILDMSDDHLRKLYADVLALV